MDKYKQIPQKLIKLQELLLKKRKNSELLLQNGDFGLASAPSNIALMKYWGKNNNLYQVPLNSSLSLSLDAYRTFTKIIVKGRFVSNDDDIVKVQNLYDHTADIHENFNASFDTVKYNTFGNNLADEKLQKFLNLILYPYASDIALHLSSVNNFPTACGIASSASGYASLVVAIANLLQLKKYFTLQDYYYWLHEWARIGSGSATRSIFFADKPAFLIWELIYDKNEFLKNNYTQTFLFNEGSCLAQKLKTSIILINTETKKISSSIGHQAGLNSINHKNRLSTIEFKFKEIKKAIEKENFMMIANLSEEDALNMHDIMQNSEPSQNYFNDINTKIIKDITNFRNNNGIKIFWTMDAGPNIHLIYSQEHEIEVKNILINFKLEFAEKITILSRSPCYFGVID